MTEIERSLRTLGLEDGASREEIAQAYKDLVRVWHPDRLMNDPALKHRAQEKLKDITIAYDVLRRDHPKHANRHAAPPRDSARSRTPRTESEQYEEARAAPPYERASSSDRQTAGKRERSVTQIIPTWIWAATGFGLLATIAARRMSLALGFLFIYGVMFVLNRLFQRRL